MALNIEGYAIISDNGMVADERGIMPSSLMIEADQTFLSQGLDCASIIVHGRNSHERQPQSPHRRRLIVTHSVRTTGPTADYPLARLWNPAGVALPEAAAELGVTDGTVAILGGTQLYGAFLPLYDVFHLSRIAGLEIPHGRPVFPTVPTKPPEQILTMNGLAATHRYVIDAMRGVTMTTWRRRTGNGHSAPP